MEDYFPSLPEEATAPGISFSFANIEQPDFDFGPLPAWIEAVIQQHECTLGALSYIFCSDPYLHQLNVEYLDHDTLTDIITFPYAEPPLVSGDLYISLDRVADNAQDRSLSFGQELRRVVIHGVLHLCGYGDKTDKEAARMRELEDEALAMLKGVS
ncbi:MAG: rRNA maturation RNase YbeY [Bacteroidota bacterium]